MTTPVQEAFTALERAIRKEERATARREIMDLLTATEALENVVDDLPDVPAPVAPPKRGLARLKGGGVGPRVREGKFESVLTYIRSNPGCSAEDIRKTYRLSKNQFIHIRDKLRPKLKTKGTTRAMRYWVKGGGK